MTDSKLQDEFDQQIRQAIAWGVCVGLGWDGQGEPRRSIKREAQRRLDKVQKAGGK